MTLNTIYSKLACRKALFGILTCSLLSFNSAAFSQGVPCPPAHLVAQHADDLDAFTFNNYGRFYTVWSHSTFQFSGLNWHVAVDGLYADPANENDALKKASRIVAGVSANSSGTAWKQSYDRLLCSYESSSGMTVFTYVIIAGKIAPK